MAGRVQLSDYVWLKPEGKSEFDIPIAVRVLNSSGNKLEVKDDDGRKIITTIDSVLKPLHATSKTSVEDMITLGELQEYTILRNLHIRYNEQLIYTYTGSMLIAINPYEILPIYTMDQIHYYQERNVSDMPPHIFAIGSDSYRELLDTNSNQCIVISGESGAGKTESTKLLLQYLAAASGKHSWIEQQIQETNPILEAFGNAKTVKNDNSSRFGKYINIYFSNTGVIEGGNIEQYLLEKSRIVRQNKGERNYHIFYSLVTGLSADEKKRLELTRPQDYEYLNSGMMLTCDGRNDALEFSDIRSAFKVLNFPDNDVWGVFNLLAAILHLGNLKFKSFSSNNIESSEVIDIITANKVATLLGVNKVKLCEALTRKSLIAHGEKIVSTISASAAMEGRDALVKNIYGCIFVYIVENINKTLHRDESLSSVSIGILDIFGFENFDVNSFEQLCINYANENLQQFFVKHIFKIEQEQYEKEGITWTNINYVDNQENLDVIGFKPMNLLSLIDEESKFPKGTDITLLNKLNTNHSSKKCYVTPKSTHDHRFGVRHFAGDVYYDVKGFLDKNRDMLTTDIKEMIMDSNNSFLLKIFPIDTHVTPQSGSRKTISLSHQFKTSLEALMKTLYNCHPFFVRCIKPNEIKKPRVFDRPLCVRQLRYAGLMETAKIRQAGYPIRYSYTDFVHRYRLVVRGIPPAEKIDCKKAAQKICEEVLNDANYRLGHTKVFLKDYHDTLLEELRHNVLITAVIKVQKNARRFICRLKYLRLREAAIVIQKHYRARGYRSKYLAMRRGYLRLQAALRSRELRRTFVQLRLFFIKLQARSKGHILRKLITDKRQIIVSSIEKLRLEKQQSKLDKKAAEDEFERKYTELMRVVWIGKDLPVENNAQNTTVIDDKYVDDVFGFLKDTATPAGTIRGSGFGVATAEKHVTEVINIPLQKEIEDESFDEFNFKKFAATYFLGNVSHQHSRKPLKHSLLELPSPVDKAASQALWITILRFMGDIAEPKYVDDKKDNTPIMTKLTDTVGRAFQKSKEFEELLLKDSYESKSKLVQKSLKKQSKLNEEFAKNFVNDEQTTEMYSTWLYSRRSTNLEKLHFIIGHGIIRKELRDEIFCQLCRQLTNNPSKASFARGWILLSLCVGCFPPSERFVKYLRSFIREGPAGYAPYCEGRLVRTFKNGPRTQPPSWLELQATKTKKPILLTVTLMDESLKTVESDSATTSEEICQQIADNVRLNDTFGFSLYITLFDKVLSLGSEGEHILDAISQCEQYAKEQGLPEKNAPWRLFYRKEVFAPWHNPTDDPIATNLIYHQVVKGVKFGEYRCNSEQDLATIAAQQHYIEYGAQIEPNLLRKVIVNYIPNQFVQSNDAALTKWEHLITKAFESSKSIQSKVDPLRCKEDIVIFAKLKWPMLFSRFFEAIKLKGEAINKDVIIVAINWTGIYIVDQSEHILLEMSYPEVTYVAYSDDKDYENIGRVTIKTIQQEEFVFQSVEASEMSSLIIYLIDGLKRRSIYVIAQCDSEGYSDAATFLEYKKGDLITLLQEFNGETLMNATWGHGRTHNGKEGLFPTEQVYILPTLSMPPSSIIEVFKKGNINTDKKVQSQYNTIQRKRMHTLEKYAKEHFRENYDIHASISKQSSLTMAKKSVLGDLWSHTREPIRLPLLKKILDDAKMCKAAVASFYGILKYMGDMPTPKPRSATEYTDEVFHYALKDNNLRDEVYCQLMKQLTNNRIQLSEERGWELMWLATGVFSCGQTLMKELVDFLKTRPHPIAKECLKRVFKIQRGGPRLYSPYIVEVEAIQHRSMQIYHKVYFPDDTDEAFEVDSSTKARDLCEQITGRLSLRNSDGFSLFVKIADKVFSVPENFYFFDFIHELVDWMKHTRPARGAGELQMNYQIFFMKKLWINTIPGKDKHADEIFYFPQELPKYLRGYHKTSKQDLIDLAALIYRARHGDDQSLLPQVTHTLDEFIPPDMLKIQSNSQWKSSISAAYFKLGQMAMNEAKAQFLKKIYQLPTFGTAFFEVRQTSDPSYPEMVVIGINKHGVTVIHPQTRDLLITYPFSQLSNWSSGNTFFHMTMGSFMRGTKILCETSLGYKMDDLISSYIAHLRQTMKQKSRKP